MTRYLSNGLGPMAPGISSKCISKEAKLLSMTRGQLSNYIAYLSFVAIASWMSPASACVAQSLPTSQSTAKLSCPFCPLTKQQVATGPTAATQGEFLDDPKPIASHGHNIEWEVIARVLSPSPLFIEVLDTDPWMNYEPDNCGIQAIQSIDAKLRTAVANLKYNELIKAKMFIAGDFNDPKFVLSDVKAIPGDPIYFHTEAGKDFCANRSGRLIVYHGPVVDLVVIYNDGGIYYRNSLFRGFSQQRLSVEELSELLKAFGDVNFEQLPATIFVSDKPELSTFTLICSRFQSVSVTGYESALAPLVRRMDDIAIKAVSNTYFLLRRGRKVELDIRPWPYPQVRLDGFRERKDRSIGQRAYGSQRATGNFEEMRQPFADDFPKKLPRSYSTQGLGDDANRYVYYAQGEKLYRVTYNPDCTPTPVCKTFESLDVLPVVGPDARLAQLKQDYQNPMSGSFLNPGVWLWPRDLAARLASLLPNGSVISNQEYEKHKPLYFELLKAGRFGSDFIEDGFLYEKVKLCQVDPGSPTECETAQFVDLAAGSGRQSRSESSKAKIATAGRDGVSMPECEYCPNPKYSEEARNKKYEGVAVLRVVVTIEGKAADIQIMKSPGMGLEKEAIEAVQQWRFKPAMKDGKPVASQVPVEVEFRLSNQ